MMQTQTNETKRGNYFLKPKSSGYLDIFSPLFSVIDDKLPTKSYLRTDIIETPTSYDLHVEVPGINKDDIKIELDEGYLTISYSVNEQEETKDKKPYRIERKSGFYSRDYFVGYDVTKDDIKASLDNGILKVVVPKIAKKEEDNLVKID